MHFLKSPNSHCNISQSVFPNVNDVTNSTQAVTMVSGSKLKKKKLNATVGLNLERYVQVALIQG